MKLNLDMAKKRLDWHTLAATRKSQPVLKHLSLPRYHSTIKGTVHQALTFNGARLTNLFFYYCRKGSGFFSRVFFTFLAHRLSFLSDKVIFVYSYVLYIWLSCSYSIIRKSINRLPWWKICPPLGGRSKGQSGFLSSVIICHNMKYGLH